MITQPIKNVKLNMAESGGHDPQSPKATEKFIGLAPNLWDSLSNHKFILTLIFTLCTLYFTLFPTSAFAANSGIFSMELWVKPTSSIASQVLVGKAEEVRMFTDASGYVGCQIKATTWQTAAQATTTALTLNTWTHVACTYDKANIKVYVNGVQVATQAQTSAPDDTANVFKIGQDDSASTPYSNLTGAVDNFEFYNYALSSKQVVSDMNAGGPSTGSGRSAAPIAYWKFDEGRDNSCSGGTNDACNSGSGGSALDGAQSGMAVPATTTSGWTNSGKFGKALSFDGEDYVQVADNIALRPPTDITISAWVNPTDFNSNEDTVVCKGANSGSVEYLFNIGGGDGGADNNLGFYDSAWRESNANVLTASTWNHVVVTRDSSNVNFYVNGKNVGTVATSGSLSVSTNKLQIGVQCDNSSNALEGIIDEVKIYNYALTSDEVKTEYNKGSSLVLGALSDTNSLNTSQPNSAASEYCVPGDTTSTSCAAPIGRWDFEEGKDNTCSATADVCDTSGQDNHGTWNGTGAKHWDTGKVGKAGNFNGSDDYVTRAKTASFNISEGSIEAWVKANSFATNNKMIASFGDASVTGNNIVTLEFTTASKIRIGAAAGGSWSFLGTTDNTFSTNTWYHVALTVNSSGNKLYVNGTQQAITYTNGSASTATFFDDIYSAANSIDIGMLNTTNYPLYFNGLIDQVRIYNYARSAAQIAYDYNRGKPVGWWKMDECQGSIVNDSSGNKNHGTITIGASGEDTLGTCTTSSTAWGSGATGKRNASLSFDGSDDKITVATAITGVQTISFWVNPTTNTDSFMDLDGGTHYITASSGTVSATGFSTPTIYINGKSGGTITGGAWNHIVVTTATSFNTTSSMAFGYKSPATADYLTGQLDDVRVYNYALTATQVKDLYNNGAVNFGPSTGAP